MSTMNFKPGDRLRYVGPNENLAGWVLEVTGPYREDTEHWDCQWADTAGRTLDYSGGCYIRDDGGLCDVRGVTIFERIHPTTPVPKETR